MTISKQNLIDFETDIASEFEKGHIRGPIHLSDGNEDQLIEIFSKIRPYDWVFSSWRSHYHALLHGVSRFWLRNEIIAGRSITVMCPEHRFFSSAIVGGTCPIAVGVAMGIKRSGGSERVWCFVGDMTAEGGAFHEAVKYAQNFDLPITFVVEDNGISTTTPTREAWGKTSFSASSYPDGCPPLKIGDNVWYYQYVKRKYPHQGIGKWIEF